MKRSMQLVFGLLILAMLVTSCGRDKKDTAQTGATTGQTATTEAQTQSSAPSNNNANQTSTTTAAVTADPSAVQFAAYDIDGTLRQSTEWVTQKPVVINFWGTWCPPCRREIPDLVKLYNEYKSKGLEIVSLAVNDQPGSVKAFTTQAGMNWVMLMGTDDIYEKYGGIRGVPTTIFVDRTGKEVQRFVGATSYETFKKAADQIL